ncbi:DUF4345 domain-containing protein [Hoeflea poritis]|uniref:DUF4345 domain-containing protein n=1 Tax=Hoeflea poritis TaxID=2993659 RepID=A0ABT4VR43_9HYPH|nr:DUF4345 domain-containing protein [Hoeflea poritis]MDA4847174.1 DUF4345 domain-containing protein [Hoeflea poritis]
MKSFYNIVLALSGLALFYVSTMRFIDPSAASFLKTHLADDGNVLTIEMMSEIRGIGAEMVLSGIVAFLGIFMPRFRVTAFVVLSVLFVGIVLGRSVSWVADGVPDESLFMPLTHEAILAAVNVFCLAYILIKERNSPGERSVAAM